MARLLHHDFPAWWRKGSKVFLACSFCLGLLAGAYVFYSAEPECAMWMCAAERRISIVGLLSVIFFPFLLSAFAVFVNQPWLFLPLAFCKALSVACVTLGIGVSFGSAGWLMRFLLMFTDLITLPVLILFWLRYISGERRFSTLYLMGYFTAVLAVGSVDIALISLILASL